MARDQVLVNFYRAKVGLSCSLLICALTLGFGTGNAEAENSTRSKQHASAGSTESENERFISIIQNLSTNFLATGEVPDVKIDELETWEAPFNMSLRFPYYLAGFDEETRPIWIGEIGKWDIRGTIAQGPEMVKILDKYVVQALYRIHRAHVKATQLSGRGIGDFSFILDFDGYSLSQISHIPTLAWVLESFRKYNLILDRHLYAAYFINVNYVAERFVNALRPVVGGIAERLEVYGTRKSTWVRVLTSKFPRDQLPQWYGGVKDFKPVRVYG